MSEPKKTIRYVPCPSCGAQVAWLPENAFRPFCSERCKLIDLGQWANEQYRIPTKDDTPPDDDVLS